MSPPDGFLVVFSHGNEVGLAFRIDAHEVAGTAGLHAEGQEEVVQVKAQRGSSDEAIAAFAGLGECHQGVSQFGVGGGHGQVQFLEPYLVDVHFIGRDGAHRELFGQRPDLAVGIHAHGLHGRILFKDGGQVRHILRNQIGQFNKVVQVGHDVRIGQGDGTEESIGHGAQAAGEHQ